MTNKNISDFVASSMDAVLNSEQHKSLFNTQYKFASDENDAKKSKKNMCSHCKCEKAQCECGPDSNDNYDQEPGMTDDQEPGMTDEEGYYDMSFSDDSQYDDYSMASDGSSGRHGNMTINSALDVAINGLLTASAALDVVGISDGSIVSLKLASLIAQAKKEMSTADKKKLVARLQKGKKGKKPAPKKPELKKPELKKPESKKSDSTSSSKSTSSTSSSSSSKAPFLKKLEVLKKKASNELIPLAIVMKAVKVVLSDEVLISKLQSAFEGPEMATSAPLNKYIQVMLNHLDLEDLSKIVEAIYTMQSSL